MHPISLLATLALSIFTLGCSARFSSAGNPPGTPRPPITLPENPKPDPEWEGGYVQLVCHLKVGKKILDFGKIGMLDENGREFRDHIWNMKQFTENDWFGIWAYFLDHDSTTSPIAKPKRALVEYYIFLRPSWDNPERTFEARDRQIIEFEKGQTVSVRWPFTQHRMECRVQPI